MVLPPYSANLMFKMLNDDATMDTIIKLIKNPAKGGTPNTREYIDFFRKYKDIRNASSLNDRLKIDDNDLYQEWLKERSENPSQRKEIKNRVFNNFIKMKTVLLSKTERSGAPALAEFIMGDVSQSEGAEAAKKWFSTITTELNRLPKAERKIRDMRKNLPKNQEGFYGKLVRYLPEVGEPTVAQFENNKKPIYSYSLAKIYLAIPDAKGVPKVSGWAGSVSDNPQHQQGIYVFKKIFSNKESKKYKFAAPDNEFREVILSASSRDITVVGTLTDEMMERYFRILATAGQQKVKGPHILVMPRFKGQKLRNVIYKKQSFQVQTIPFVKRLLSEPATDRIFENSAQSIQITPALSEDSFKVQWKTKNPEENVDSELYEQDFRKYLTVFRLPEDILAVAEELGVAFAKERKEEIRNLTLIDGAYHALTTKEMELVSFIIEEIQDELSTQFKDADIDRDERDKYLVNIGIAQEGVSTEKTLKAAINNIISGRTSISSKLLDNTMPNKYLTGNRIGLEDAFIITEFLLYRINRTGTRSQVAKIDTLLQKQGEGLSVDNKTLEQAVEALVRLMQKELIDFNRQFRVELIKHIGDRLRNKDRNVFWKDI